VFEGRLYTNDVLGRLTRIDYDRDTVRRESNRSELVALSFALRPSDKRFVRMRGDLEMNRHVFELQKGFICHVKQK